MNEVENHYAGQSASHSGGSTGGAPGSQSSADAARSALDQASSRAKEGLRSVKETARSTVDTARQAVGERYGNATRSVADARRRSAAGITGARRGVERFVDENPVMIGVAGLAAGLLVGALLPGTRRENEVFGRYADEVRDQGLRYARELAEQGKHFVEENLDVAGRTRSGEGGPGGNA